MNTYAQKELDKVSGFYDPENDLIPDTIRTTHTDYVIIEALRESIDHVAVLGGWVAQLDARVRRYKGIADSARRQLTEAEAELETLKKSLGSLVRAWQECPEDSVPDVLQDAFEEMPG